MTFAADRFDRDAFIVAANVIGEVAAVGSAIVRTGMVETETAFTLSRFTTRVAGEFVAETDLIVAGDRVVCDVQFDRC